MWKYVLGIGLVLVTLATSAQAATYYIATNGQDTNPCTQAQPCRTIFKGISMLSAGDTLLLRAGTYSEHISSGAQTIPSGTSFANPVTIAAYPGETVIIDGSMYLAPEPPTPTIQYVIFDRLIFDGSNLGGGGGIILAHISHIRLQNGEVRHSGENGIMSVSAPTTDDLQFINMKVYGSGWYDGHAHGFYIQTGNNLIDNCEIYNNTAYGVQIYNGYRDSNPDERTHNNIIRNSRFVNNGTGATIGDGNNTQFYNNLIYNNAVKGIDVNKYIDNAQLYNNTFYSNGPGPAIEVSAYSTNAILRNNILWLNGSGILDAGAGTVMSHNMETNPQFVDASTGNFQLQATSPARDAGMTVATVPTDITGMARPQGPAYDIGAYEYAAVVTPVATALQFVQHPTWTLEDTTMAPAVTVRIVDQFGVTFPSTALVGLTIGTNPSAGSLTGGAPVAAVAGVATFAGLSITQPGVGYTLVAASTGLTSATSTAFAITALPPPSTELVLFLTTGGFLSP